MSIPDLAVSWLAIMSHSRSNVNSDEPGKHSAFKSGDVLIFIVFPIVLILGFLLFLWWRKTSADPNLRLVAQLTDDISVELVAVVRQNQAKSRTAVWWKPNGLPASDVSENPKGRTTRTRDPGFYFLYHYIDDRTEATNAVVKDVAGSWVSWISETRESGRGTCVVVAANAKPDVWNSVDTGVRISTEGKQYVGELTLGNAKLSTLVGGRAATIEVLSGKALSDATKFRASSCVLEITEPIVPEGDNSSWFDVEVFDDAGAKNPLIGPSFLKLNSEKYQQRFYFNSVDWSRIVIHRTVYDVHVTFESVSAQLNSMTSPRIGEISNARKK
jgi:hypothetical protein